MTRSSGPEITINDLTVDYPTSTGPVRALDGLSCSIKAGTITVVSGPSGSGKTTLLSCLAALLTPTSGSITVGSTQVHELTNKQKVEFRRRRVGIVFQAFNLLPSLTAEQNVMAPLLAAGSTRKQATIRAQVLLHRVGLSDRCDHRPGQLSGGQQQRVSLARALANDPDLLLADEPTANLDYANVDGVLSMFERLAEHGVTIVVATHDARIEPLADTVMSVSKPRASDDQPNEAFGLSPSALLVRRSEPFDQGPAIDLRSPEDVSIPTP